jgi:amino acid transporter
LSHIGQGRRKAPVNLLFLQEIMVSVLGLSFVVLASVEATYQILSQLTVTLYLVKYLPIFAAAIRLRTSQPNTPRPYRVPFETSGMYLFGGLGFLGSLLAFVLSFVPPNQIAAGSPATFVAMLIGGTILFVAIPFVIYAIRRPGWRQAGRDFEPFSWERAGKP